MKKATKILVSFLIMFLIGMVSVRANEVEPTMVSDDEELQACIAGSGERVCKLANDINFTTYTFISAYGSKLTIDLNGHNLDAYYIQVYNVNFNLTSSSGEGVVNLVGKLSCANNSVCTLIDFFGSPSNVADYSVMNVDKNVEIKFGNDKYLSTYAIAVTSTSYYYGVKVNYDGKLTGTTDNTVIGTVQGLLTNTEGNIPEINFTKNAVLKSADGIYAAGYGKWNINGARIDATNFGIEARAGIININDAKITATAVPTEVRPNGSGSTTKGSAVAIAQHTTKLPLEVNISGGVFEAYTPVNESNPENNDATSIAKVAINITGGTFKTISGGLCSVNSQDVTKFISSGKFNNPVSETYIKDGYKLYTDGTSYYVDEAGNYNIELPDLMEVGKSSSVKITATGGVAKYMTIESSNNNIIKYENDKLKAIKEGTANIIVRTGIYNSDPIEYKVTVYRLQMYDDSNAGLISGSITALLENEETKELVKEILADNPIIEVNIDTTKSKEVTKEEVNKIAEKANGATVSKYFDIDVVLKGKTNNKSLSMEELTDKIKIVIDVPTDLPEVKTGYIRSYSIIRIHNGVAEVLEASLTADKKIAFETDKFSTYALAYKDVPDTAQVSNPKTYDDSLILLSMLVISMTGFIVTKKVINKRLG